MYTTRSLSVTRVLCNPLLGRPSLHCRRSRLWYCCKRRLKLRHHATLLHRHLERKENRITKSTLLQLGTMQPFRKGLVGFAEPLDGQSLVSGVGHNKAKRLVQRKM